MKSQNTKPMTDYENNYFILSLRYTNRTGTTHQFNLRIHYSAIIGMLIITTTVILYTIFSV